MSDVRKPLSAATRYCAVLGHPIKHSASPAMQNAGIAALGLDWRYLAFDVHPEKLKAVIDGAKAMKYVGLNLTVPHKLLALAMVDELDESAKLWGAVNTIRFEALSVKGKWLPLHSFDDAIPEGVRAVGFNTDAEAITRSLTDDLGLKLPGARVLLLGAGGAGRTAALRLAADKVSELFLINRTAAKAKELGQEVQRRFPDVKVWLDYPKASSAKLDLVLNATSLGLKVNDASPLDESQFDLKQAMHAYDMIYRPARTAFLLAAEQAGCRVANGLGMLLYQGAKALEIWTGKTAPIKIMREALVKNIYGD